MHFSAFIYILNIFKIPFRFITLQFISLCSRLLCLTTTLRRWTSYLMLTFKISHQKLVSSSFFFFENWKHFDYRKIEVELDSNALSCIFPGSFDPHMLVLLAYVLALTNRFPEPLIREIFRVDFLAKLDAQLESTCSYLMLVFLLAVRNFIAV